MHEVSFLGHKCTDKGILPKKYFIQNYPVPHYHPTLEDFLHFAIITDDL